MFDQSVPGLLQGDVALVTGAAQGNGAAIARGLAASGARVILADIDGAGAAAQAAALGGEAHALDVADRAACAALAGRIGPVSILVNNAGILRRGGVADDGFLDALQQQLAVNLQGAANMVQAFLPQLRAAKGRVVNIASIAAYVGTGATAYGATKAGLAQLTRGLAAELAPDGIRVNALAPGVIATPMTESTRTNPPALQRFLQHTPMGRVGEPEELVGPVLFLVSRLSSYVTGVTLAVDGGYLTA